MGQQHRRPEAGEDNSDQVSQEGVLKEVTTGPPPETFASVRREQQKQNLEGKKILPTSRKQGGERPAHPRTRARAARPGPQHPRGPFPFRDLVRQPARLPRFLPRKMYSLVTTVQTAAVAQTIKAGFLLKYKRAERCGARRVGRPADAVADAVAPARLSAGDNWRARGGPRAG